MMDGRSEQEIATTPQPQDLDSVLSSIQLQCNNEVTGGVFPFVHREGIDPETAKKENAANLVYDMLMTTLGDVGADAVKEGKGDGPQAKEYEQVARAVELMAVACRGLADDTIQLLQNKPEEQYHQRLGDIVHAYSSRNVVLNGKLYDEIKVFIRPNPLIRSVQSEGTGNEKQKKLIEYKQARMNIEIIPQDHREGAISLRVDQEDLDKDMEITYDLDIRPHRNAPNVVDALKFSQAGQREGHHFSSTYTVKDLKMGNFGNLLETFNTKFENNAKQTEKQK